MKPKTKANWNKLHKDRNSLWGWIFVIIKEEERGEWLAVMGIPLVKASWRFLFICHVYLSK